MSEHLIFVRYPRFFNESGVLGNEGDMWFQGPNGVWYVISRPADWATMPYFLGLDQATGHPAWLALTGVVSEIIRGAFIASTAQLFSPTVTRTISVGTVISTIVLYPPAVEVSPDVTGGHITSGLTLFAPTVSSNIDISLAAIPSGSTLFAPSVVVEAENARVAIGSFLTGTAAAGATVEVNILDQNGDPFTPKAVIFWWNGISGAGNVHSSSNIRAGIGFAVSSTDRRNVGGQSTDGASTTATDFQLADESAVRVLGTTGALAGALDFVSMDADGFTMIVDTQFAADLRVHYLAIGGTDITNVKTGTVLEPAATGNQVTTGLGFSPDVLITATSFFVGTPPSQGGQHVWSVGMAVRDSGQALVCWRDRDNVTTTATRRWQRSGHCVGRTTGASLDSLGSLGSLVSFDADGFTINWSNRNSTGVHTFYLAIAGGNWSCGELLTETDTVTAIPVTGLGMQPVGLFFLSDCETEDANATNTTAPAMMSLGAAIGPSVRHTSLLYSNNFVSDSACTLGQRTDAVWEKVNLDGSLLALMDLQSLDADGFTCIMDDADTGNNTVYYLAFGPTP